MTINKDSERNTVPIRVLIANLSGVLLEIVRQAIQQQPDMTVRLYVKDAAELSVSISDQTDVLIIGAPYAYPPPPICHDLWHSYPDLKVLVLTPSGDPAVVYWLSVRRHRLKTVSLETLVGSIRSVQSIEWTSG